MRRFTLLLVIAFCATYASVAQADLKARFDQSPNDVNGATFEYDSGNGDFRVYQQPDATIRIQSLEIRSQSGMMNAGAECDPAFASHAGIWTSTFFNIAPGGRSEWSCEAGMQPGLSLQLLVEDLTFDGSIVGGNTVEQIPDIVVRLPEPHCSATLPALLLMVVCWRRR